MWENEDIGSKANLQCSDKKLSWATDDSFQTEAGTGKEDEKKLMEYSFELYQAAKNIGALAKEREEYDSLWEEEEEEKEVTDPHEIADNAEAFAAGPEVVSVADTVASVSIPE